MYKVVKINTESGLRYAIEDSETGAILDDAHGYGYKTPKKAKTGFLYSENKRRTKDDGERIAKARKKACLAQKDLAGLLHVSVGKVVDWEKGRTEPDEDEKSRIAFSLGVKKDQIFKRRKYIYVNTDAEEDPVETVKRLYADKYEVLKTVAEKMLEIERTHERKKEDPEDGR